MSEPALEGLLLALAREGHDFRDYRRDTLARRIDARMTAQGTRDLGAYAARVAADPVERFGLVEALVVPTSAFFRDPALFDALARDVLPGRFGGRAVRAWVAGVATGEEAWSLAMLLADAGEGEIFGSDRSPAALAIAMRARYRAGAADAVPAALRARYLVATEASDQVEIGAALRPRVRWCHHDLLGSVPVPPEAVLAQFDLVLCRNVLIYLQPALQAKLLLRLRGALAADGVLAIGPYEQVPPGLGLAPLPGSDDDASLFVRAPL